VIIDLGSLKKQ